MALSGLHSRKRKAVGLLRRCERASVSRGKPARSTLADHSLETGESLRRGSATLRLARPVAMARAGAIRTTQAKQTSSDHLALRGMEWSRPRLQCLLRVMRSKWMADLRPSLRPGTALGQADKSLRSGFPCSVSGSTTPKPGLAKRSSFLKLSHPLIHSFVSKGETHHAVLQPRA